MTTPAVKPGRSFVDWLMGRPAPAMLDASAAQALPVTAGTADKPAPLSLTSSAARITAKTIGASRTSRKPDTAWQGDAWDMYDLIGEQRFLANVLAGRGSQARLFVGRLSHENVLAAPEPVEDVRVQAILDAIGVTSVGRSQIVLRALIGYFIPGETYLVGIPKRLLPGAEQPEAAELYESIYGPLEDTLEDLDWRTLSSDEVAIKQGTVELKLAEMGGEALKVSADDVYLIHSWRPHPRRAWEPDSPTRSSLPVLRELVGLTMAISSQTDSRLAGAGILAVSDKITNALKRARGFDEEDEEDPFTDELVTAMITPISDRSSAAAQVPLVVTVPNDDRPVSDLMHHFTFGVQFDAEMRPLREEAIRRLALGQDAPPELLLGVGGMNHWGAWLVREDVITTHVEPPLALFCDTLTTQYLRPALLATGMSEEDANELVVWYDVSHLISRPDRSTDAQSLYDKGELSGEALRRENGFDESDAPPVLGERDPAVDLALQLVAQAPSLIQMPGLPAIVEQIRAIQAGRAATAAAAEEATGAEGGAQRAPDRPDAETPAGEGLPSTSGDDAEMPPAGSAP